MKNIQNHLLKFGLSLLFTLFIGCEPEDYTLPAEFRMNFGIKHDPVLDGTIIIDYIGISLSLIDIRGYREEGGDVFLTRSFGSGKIFKIYPTNNTYSENLDIPHGLYNPITFSFKFQPDEEESYLLEDIDLWLEDYENEVDPIELKEGMGEIISYYLENIDPCIIVTGKFIYNSVVKNLVIVINDPMEFNISGTSGGGLSEVFLNRKKVNIGILQFNPAYWFSVITPEIMKNAYTGLIDYNEYILLSKHINHEIYFQIFNRIEESTNLLIND